jgi:Fur family ferric uptake transcriptional regulator
MNEVNKIPEDIQLRYEEYLKKENLRNTDERLAILTKICAGGKHIDIETIQKDLSRNSNYRVSKTTIYNTLELFIDAGIIIKHFRDKKNEYELRTKARTHVHLVCSKCGKIWEAKINPDLLVNSIAGIKSRFTPDYFSLYIYGECSECNPLQTK